MLLLNSPPNMGQSWWLSLILQVLMPYTLSRHLLPQKKVPQLWECLAHLRENPKLKLINRHMNDQGITPSQNIYKFPLSPCSHIREWEMIRCIFSCSEISSANLMYSHRTKPLLLISLMPHDLLFPHLFEARYCAHWGAVRDFTSDLSKPLLLVLFLSLNTCCFLTQAFFSSRPLGKSKNLLFFWILAFPEKSV